MRPDRATPGLRVYWWERVSARFPSSRRRTGVVVRPAAQHLVQVLGDDGVTSIEYTSHVYPLPNAAGCPHGNASQQACEDCVMQEVNHAET